MPQQANLESETVSSLAAEAAGSSPKTVAPLPPQEEKGKAAVVEGKPVVHIDIPFRIDPTTDAATIDQAFAAMAQHRLAINLQIHIEAGSSHELVDHVAASVKRHFYGDKP